MDAGGTLPLRHSSFFVQPSTFPHWERPPWLVESTLNRIGVLGAGLSNLIVTQARIGWMNLPRAAVLLAVFGPLTFTSTPVARGQDIIGEAIERVVLPGLGEAAKRGIGEELGERLFGRRPRPVDPGPLPSPQPTPLPYPNPRPYPKPQPGPSPQPYPNPQPGQIWRPKPPTITQPYLPTEPAPAPPKAPPNQIVPKIIPATNASPQETALTIVLERGLAASILFARREADTLAGALRAGTEDAGAEPSDRVEAAGLAEAIASDTAPTSKATLESTRQRIDALRESLTGVVADSSLPARELAIIAERAKNMKNMLVLGDLAHLAGAQRRNDLFPLLTDAVQRADAPSNVLPALTGFIAVAGPEDSGPENPGADDAGAEAAALVPVEEPRAALFNPSTMTQPVHFVVDRETAISLGPGEMIWFDRPFVITFENGAGQTKSYTLADGTYAWSLKEQRLDVNKRPQMRLLIDGSELPVDFEFVLGGQRERILAGEQKEWMITGPLRIIFDRGNRELEPSSAVYFGGDFRIGVNSTTSGYELIPTSILQDSANEQNVSLVAKLHWRQSLDAVMRTRGSLDQADAAVESLLDGIE